MMVSGVRIRDYEPEDAPAMARLFHETIRSVNLADYSPEQVRAWTPEVLNPEIWNARMSGRYTLIAEEGGEVIAFAELEETEGDGHLDMFYCRKDAVRRSVGTNLYEALEKLARERGLKRIFTEASITARPFFERQGFRVVREQTVAARGVEMTNFAMEKRLAPER